MATKLIPIIQTHLDQFKDNLDKNVDSLIELYDKLDKETGPKARWMQTIPKSGIVLLGASFENFCETVVCDSLNHLAANNVMARKYPERFRHWLFREDVHMRNIGIDAAKDYISLSLQLYSDVRPLQKSELKLERIREEFANPTAKNINWLIGLFDIQDYLKDIDVTVNGADVQAKRAIEELANRRNNIAHGDMTEKPTRDDLARLKKTIQLIANRIAKDVSEYTNACLK